jgi:hypothetical protein
MKFAFLTPLYILSHALVAKGQFATIKDADGFTNVRAGSNINAKIIGQLHDGDVFAYGEEKNGWINIAYFPADSSERVYLEGYIHKDRFLPLEKLRCLLENHQRATNHHLRVHNDSLTVELATTAFQEKEHTVQKDNGAIQKIDGRRPLGTDGERPLDQLIRLRVTIKGDTVDIPATACENLYDPTLETCKVFSDNRSGFMYIHLLSNRSAAGGYEMVWIFKNNRYVKRYVDQSND